MPDQRIAGESGPHHVSAILPSLPAPRRDEWYGDRSRSGNSGLFTASASCRSRATSRHAVLVYRTRVYPTAAEKWANVLSRVRILVRQQRPVLIGTRSVGASEHLSALLHQAGLAHEVLNARQDRQEAEIIARAGEPGQITVATNMAGRGTDISIGPQVAAQGGLHVIATERNDARRIDRQLFGRCGRQGDPGSFEAILSLEDDIIMFCAPRPIQNCLRKLDSGKLPLAQGAAAMVMRRAQRRVERRHAQARRDLLKQDLRLADALAFTGPME